MSHQVVYHSEKSPCLINHQTWWFLRRSWRLVSGSVLSGQPHGFFMAKTDWFPGKIFPNKHPNKPIQWIDLPKPGSLDLGFLQKVQAAPCPVRALKSCAWTTSATPWVPWRSAWRTADFLEENWDDMFFFSRFKQETCTFIAVLCGYIEI